MILSKLFARKPDPANSLYEAIVAAARQEKFYAEMGVPDTLDGRFDMMVLNLFLVLDRLKGQSEAFRQRLTNIFFQDMDRTLREMGVGDLSVAKKIRPMAEAYHGRIQAYSLAGEQGDDAMLEALKRNVYVSVEAAEAKQLLTWTKEAKAQLLSQETNAILSGKLHLP